MCTATTCALSTGTRTSSGQADANAREVRWNVTIRDPRECDLHHVWKSVNYSCTGDVDLGPVKVSLSGEEKCSFRLETGTFYARTSQFTKWSFSFPDVCEIFWLSTKSFMGKILSCTRQRPDGNVWKSRERMSFCYLLHFRGIVVKIKFTQLTINWKFMTFTVKGNIHIHGIYVERNIDGGEW